jgi:hypothetical protein
VKALEKMVSSSYHKFSHAIHVRINSFKKFNIVSFSTESFSFDSLPLPRRYDLANVSNPPTHSAAPSETQALRFENQIVITVSQFP